MVAVWWVDLDDERALRDGQARSLSHHERARAERFRFDRHRERWLAGRIALRRIVAAELGVDPADVEYSAGLRGKPSLDGRHRGALAFNLSHSGARALVATTRGAELGVDVEEVHPMEDLRDVAERHFAAEERECLFALPVEAQVDGFYRLWTRKEAYIKAIGTGLGHPLDRFAVTQDVAECRFVHLDGDSQQAALWSLVHLEPPGAAGAGRYVGAVAIERAAETVEQRLFTWTD